MRVPPPKRPKSSLGDPLILTYNLVPSHTLVSTPVSPRGSRKFPTRSGTNRVTVEVRLVVGSRYVSYGLGPSRVLVDRDGGVYSWVSGSLPFLEQCRSVSSPTLSRSSVVGPWCDYQLVSGRHRCTNPDKRQPKETRPSAIGVTYGCPRDTPLPTRYQRSLDTSGTTPTSVYWSGEVGYGHLWTGNREDSRTPRPALIPSFTGTSENPASDLRVVRPGEVVENSG